VKLRQAACNSNLRVWLLMQFCVYSLTVFQTKFYHLFSQALFTGSRLDGLQGPLLSAAHVVRSLLSVFLVLPAVERHGIFPVFRCQGVGGRGPELGGRRGAAEGRGAGTREEPLQTETRPATLNSFN